MPFFTLLLVQQLATFCPSVLLPLMAILLQDTRRGNDNSKNNRQTMPDNRSSEATFDVSPARGEINKSNILYVMV